LTLHNLAFALRSAELLCPAHRLIMCMCVWKGHLAIEQTM